MPGSANGLDICQRLFRRIPVSSDTERDLGALDSKPAGDLTAQAAVCAGDDHHPAFKAFSVVPA